MSFPSVNGFCDLNIAHNADNRLIQRVIEYGYKAIALNWTVDVSKTDGKLPSKKKKGNEDNNSNLVILPKELISAQKNLISKYSDKLKVFLRITIVFSKPDQLKQVFSSQQYKSYDITAVLPTTDVAYQHACGNSSIDLLSFEIEVTHYRPNRKLHKQLTDRNGYFEIMYSQALKSSVRRQETITMAQYFHIYGKSKNVIISSGAVNYLELRNPFDVANLGLLLGLSEEQSKCSLTRNCKMLILTAAGRRYGKVAITVELSTKDDDEEPSIKRTKLNPSNNDHMSDVTHSISSLTTT
ncbi:ribonuclease P protein subunit p30 [Planococcus citri]|uniref:ribonuclease P protein subunit p30 n=1 Tax=Planococcus citri TaxID=170843 RepID=UPI0031F77446